MSVHQIEALDDVGRQLHDAALRLPVRRFPRLRTLAAAARALLPHRPAT